MLDLSRRDLPGKPALKMTCATILSRHEEKAYDDPDLNGPLAICKSLHLIILDFHSLKPIPKTLNSYHGRENGCDGTVIL